MLPKFCCRELDSIKRRNKKHFFSITVMPLVNQDRKFIVKLIYILKIPQLIKETC